MPRQTALALLASCLLLLQAGTAQAHHSIAHDFDVGRSLRLQGTVTRFDWRNPHIGLELAARNTDGSTTRWQIEGGPPNALVRRGWSRDSLKAGAVIVVEGWPARDGSARANAREFQLPDGRRLDAASSYHPPGR